MRMPSGRKAMTEESRVWQAGDGRTKRREQKVQGLCPWNPIKG